MIKFNTFYTVTIILYVFFSKNIYADSIHDFNLAANLSKIKSKNVNMLELEKKLNLTNLVKIKMPNGIDPLWWFIYKKKSFYIKFATNTENPSYDASSIKKESFIYTGHYEFFSELNENATFSTFCINSIEEKIKYNRFLNGYDLRIPISIKGLEEELMLNEPFNVEVPAFIQPMWVFYYKKNGVLIKLMGLALRDNIGSEDLASQYRGEFLFTGYWGISYYP